MIGEPQERQPLLSPSHGHESDVRRSSVVSLQEDDAGNPKEWSKKYKWFCVALLCFFAVFVYIFLLDLIQCPRKLSIRQNIHVHWHRACSRRRCART